MNTKLYVALFAAAFALSACNNEPAVEAETAEVAAPVDTTVVAADAAGAAAVEGVDAAGATTAEAIDPAAMPATDAAVPATDAAVPAADAAAPAADAAVTEEVQQ